MIYESKPWKTQLLRSASWLEKLVIDKDEGIAERQLYRLEKELLIGFYSIRKLLETYKVSDTLKNSLLFIECHPTKSRIDYFNRFEIDDIADLSIPYFEILTLQEISSQFIHSYIFTPNIKEDNTIAGCFVGSKIVCHPVEVTAQEIARGKKIKKFISNGKIYYVILQQILYLFRSIGKNYPTKIKRHFDTKLDRWVTSVE